MNESFTLSQLLVQNTTTSPERTGNFTEKITDLSGFNSTSSHSDMTSKTLDMTSEALVMTSHVTDMTSHVSTNDVITSTTEGNVDEGPEKFDTMVDIMFTKIHPVYTALIVTTIFTLSISLNSLIMRHYLKKKTSNRPYVLTMVAIDLSLVLLVLVPEFILDVSTPDGSHPYIRVFLYFLTNIGFGTYFYPSAFLCLDRCSAVFYPVDSQRF